VVAVVRIRRSRPDPREASARNHAGIDELLEEAAHVECEHERGERGGRQRRGVVEALEQDLDGSRHAVDGSAVGSGVPLLERLVPSGDEAELRHHESPRRIASRGEPHHLDERGDVVRCAVLLEVLCLLAGSRVDAFLEEREEQVGLGREVRVDRALGEPGVVGDGVDGVDGMDLSSGRDVTAATVALWHVALSRARSRRTLVVAGRTRRSEAPRPPPDEAGSRSEVIRMLAKIRNEPTLVVALFQAALVVAVNFGWELTTQQMSAVVAFAAAASALFVRHQVTPVSAQAAGSGSSPEPTVLQANPTPGATPTTEGVAVGPAPVG